MGDGVWRGRGRDGIAEARRKTVRNASPVVKADETDTCSAA